MATYEFTDEQIIPLVPTSFQAAGIRERGDLQRLLRARIDVISPDTLILAEEFGEWDERRRRIDLLGLDKKANFVVIELKRTDDGALMELQAIRYAAMVSTMTFEQAVAARSKFMQDNQLEGNAQEQILDFLGWSEPLEEQFGQDTRIVLVGQGFGKELKTSAMWLNDHGLDLQCVQIQPLAQDKKVFVEVRQIIPQPEIEDYQIRVRTKIQKQRLSRASASRRGAFDISFDGKLYPRQSKGRSILLIVRELLLAGIEPSKLEALADGCQRYFWFQLNGDINPAEFVELAKREAARNHRSFDPIRWFCSGEDLIRAQGKTYALSTQWGSPTWDEMMRRLESSFPRHQISHKLSDETLPS